MHKQIAMAVSAVLHPLVMPLACVFLAARFDWFISGTSNTEQIHLVYLIIALSTIAFPALNILLLKWYGVVKSLEMSTKAERYAPFISTLFFFSLGYFMLRKGSIPDSIYSIILGCIGALLMITLINFKWKISAHAAGIFGVLGTCLALFQIHHFGNIWLLSILILLGGMVLTSRMLLRAHTPAQVYLGALVGFMATYVLVFYQIVI